jgi:hypothetical protein
LHSIANDTTNADFRAVGPIGLLLTNEDEAYLAAFCTRICKFVDDKINYAFSLAFTTSPAVYHSLKSYQMMTMMKWMKYIGTHLRICVRMKIQINVFVSGNILHKTP